MLAGEKGARHVQGELRLPDIERHIDRPAGLRLPNIVDHDVEPSVPTGDARHQALDLRRIDRLTHDRLAAAALPLDAGPGQFGRGQVAVGADHEGPLTGE